MMTRQTMAGVITAGVAVLAVAAAVVVPRLVPHAPVTTAGYAVAAGTDVCGTGWPTVGGSGGTVRSGTQTFRISNTSVAGVEVQLVDPRTGALYLDAEGLGSGAAQTYRVRLAAGTYRFRCLPADADAVDGEVVHVTGAAHVVDATPAVVPVTRNDLIPAAKTYGDWIQGRLPVLHQEVAALDADVRAGDLAAAQRDWLTGHLEYEQLGAAYGAFGDDDTAIDGVPASGKTALDDQHLGGFHKLEALLWSGAPAERSVGPADALVAAVGHLQQTFPTAQIDPLDIGLRAHEILENALQFEATGASDAGSHTTLATIDANIRGTEQALAPLRPLLATRYPDLADTDAALTALRTDVESDDHDGTWTPLSGLDRPSRERLDADLGAAVERLAPIAAICDLRRTS